MALAATFLAGRGPVAVAITAAAATAAWGVVGTRFTPTAVIALGEGRAHLFAGRRTWTGLRVGHYEGPLVGGELTFDRGGACTTSGGCSAGR